MDLTLPSGTPASIARAESASSGLVIVPDIWGLRPLFTDLCEWLRDRSGRTVIAFEPFPGQSLPGPEDPDAMAARGQALFDRSDAELLADAVAAADATGCEHVALMGFCMGGMYAFKASASGRFDRVVSFYGMAHVPEPWSGPEQSDPVEALSARRSVDVMAIVGTEDIFIPGEHADDLEAVGVTVHRYEDAEHGFVHDATRPAHRADDAADAWDKVLAFLAD